MDQDTPPTQGFDWKRNISTFVPLSGGPLARALEPDRLICYWGVSVYGASRWTRTTIVHLNVSAKNFALRGYLRWGYLSFGKAIVMHTTP